MVTSIESRLWLAVHLLYSNASQAFDVYQAVVLQSEHAINNQDIAAVFNRLVQVYEKIPAISSNLAFYEFEFEEIDQWKIIYKNSQKTQLIIFVGVLIFELKISQIAPTLKLAPEKAQFLFHQIFKKLASSSQKLKYNEQLEFKRQNDNKISYLFTYENLVDYCLEQLTPEETEKVRTGLKIYPTLQVAKEEYSRIISQIQNLKVQKDRTSVASNVRPNIKLAKETGPTSVNASKGLTPFQMKALTGTFIVVVSILLIKPVKTFFELNTKAGGTVVLQEVAVNNQPNKSSDEPVVTAVESADSTTASTDVAVVSSDVTSSTTVAAVQPAPPPQPAVVAAEEVSKTTQVAAPTGDWEGGLYRGTLIVKDIKAVNEEIRSRMLAGGAVKAGEVELGWQKSSDTAYYHYTLPEVNKESVESYLKKIGTLKIKFEKHPRKIPVGTRRFIIEVKQN